MLQAALQPWHAAVADPAKTQEEVLHNLLRDYAKAEYGAQHGADQVDTLADYRRSFLIASYEDYRPTIQQVMAGEVEKLLCEEPVGWAITRGTTKGDSKFIPMTPTDLRMRVSAGRAMMNYVASTGRYDLFAGVNLNLNFPSVVGTVRAGERELEYGYSSGIYTKFVSRFTPIRSLPTQEAIDELGGGKSLKDWDRRFELAYQQCRDQNVTLVGGVCPTALRFARYLKREHRTYPRDLWKTQVMTLGSVPGIAPATSPPPTRCMPSHPRDLQDDKLSSGQQREAGLGADIFFFRADQAGSRCCWAPRRDGRAVMSPRSTRYRIGDLILALESPYFRCIGREEWWTPLAYAWQELASFNFGQL
jgi:hypothetical protein